MPSRTYERRILMPANANEPLIRIAEIELDPSQITAYKALLSEEIEAAVRIEPGVLFLYALAIKGSPDKIRVIEGYAGQAAYEVHLNTPHFLKYKELRQAWSGRCDCLKPILLFLKRKIKLPLTRSALLLKAKD
jgi:quinol monooxygenase YgiN